MSNIMEARAASSGRGSVLAWVVGLVGLAVLVWFAWYARVGAISPRVANPEVAGAPRPVEFLFGFRHWVEFHQYLAILVVGGIFLSCAVAWRRTPGHPYILMTIASTAIVWMDPVMNWAPYAVYNPQLWHLPEDWPLVNLSPTVEPFIVVGYALFYFGPFFPASWILKRMQARRTKDAFVCRHPLLSLAGLIFVIGFIFDVLLEAPLIQTGLYIYSQVIPWGSIFAGTTFQFPLIWESSFVNLVMIPAGLLCYSEDGGLTVAEKLASKWRLYATRPHLATFLLMFAVCNVAYAMYGGAFAIIRATGAATAVACPYPYPEAKVYDPQGYYEREGQAGPYSEGHWTNWMTGEGRPESNPRKPDAGCPAAQAP